VEPRAARTDTNLLLELMARQGQAYLASGEQTALVELFLQRIATAYGMRRSRVVAFPTAIFISVHDATGERVTLAEGPTQTLRLDQIAAVYTLGDELKRGDVVLRHGLQRLAAIMKQPPRFGPIVVVAGHTILTTGLALVLMPTPVNLATAVILGALIGLLKVLNRDRPILAAPLSVVAAGLTSFLVFMGIRYGLPVNPEFALVPPLVTFLPGAMLTFGMVELAYGDMVSGSSRLLTGGVQLVLLAFGLALGAALVGYRPEDLAEAKPEAVLESWRVVAAWMGVMVFAVGAYLTFSAPAGSLSWLLLVVGSTYAAQQVSAWLLGQEISGFFGMLVATPMGYLIQVRYKGPPSMVTFLPSFWLMVPGALGLLSVKRMLSEPSELDGIVSMFLALAAIALGTLVGASLYRSLTERYGWVALQIGRVERYLRRRS